jgi:hypothetical protein
MSEDLGVEDMVGDVLGFEHVATDGAVARTEVALVCRADRGSGSVTGELRTGGGVNGLWGKGSF